MKQLIKTTVALTVVATLGGCSIANTMDARVEQSEVKTEMKKLEEANSFEKVLTLTRPPMKVERVKEVDRATWLDREVKLYVDGLPLNLVLRDLLGPEIQLEYGFGVNPIRPVSVYFEGPIEEALNILAVTSNYGLDPSEGKLEIATQQTKTFFIPVIAGENSYQIGSSGQGGSAAGVLEGEISSTGAGDGQYSNVKSGESNAVSHIKAGVETILKGVSSTGSAIQLGHVTELKSLSSLVVKASPRIMREVESFIEASIEELKREVDLEIRVVEFLIDESTQVGADINAMISAGGNSYNIASGGLTLTPDGSVDLSFGSSSFGGHLEGSEGLVQYLEQAGDVTVKTFQRVKASNYQMQEVDLSEITSYISKIETSVVEGSDTPNVSVTKGLVRDGVKMLVLPTIKDDSVYLRLNGTLSKLLKFDEEQISGLYVKDPKVRQARFNTSGRYEYNKDIIVTHMRQEKTDVRDAKFAEVQTGVTSSKTLVDTMVIVTPRRRLAAN